MLSPCLSEAQTRPLAEALVIATDDPCLGAAELAESARERLGLTRFDARFVVRVSEDGGLHIAIEFDGTHAATRRFEALPEGCAERTATVAVAIALALEAALLEAPAVEPSLDGPSRREPSPGPLGRVRVEDEAVPRRREAPQRTGETWRGTFFARLAMQWAAFVTPHALGQAGLRAEHSSGFGAALSLEFAPPQPVGSEASIDGELLTTAVEAFGGLTWGPLTGRLHAGARMGSAAAELRDTAVDGRTRLPFVAAVAAVEASWELLPSLHLEARIELVVPLVRPVLELVVDGAVRERTRGPEVGLGLAVGAAM
jgi:hypothetical protein